MNSITKATPRTYFAGVEDDSAVALPVEVERTPMFLPIFFVQTPAGDDEPHLFSLAGAKQYYGAKAWDQDSKYFSHQTMGSVANGAGYAFFVRMLDESAAKKPTIALKCEVVTPAVEGPLKQRTADWALVPDGNGGFETHPTFVGTEVKLHFFFEAVNGAIGAAAAVTDFTSTSGTRGGTVVTLFEAEHKFFGDGGDHRGMRLQFPLNAALTEGDVETMADAKSLLALVQMVQRESASASPVVLPTTELGEESILIPTHVAKVAHAVRPVTLRQEDLISKYSGKNSIGIPVSNSFGKAKWYSANILALQNYVKGFELANRAKFGAPSWDEEGDEAYLLNVFRGKTMDGKPLFGAAVGNAIDEFDSITTHYMYGGNDGPVSEETLAQLVKDKLPLMWERETAPLLDRARFPFRNMIDTGFPHEVKEVILMQTAWQKDFAVDVCDQDILEPENSLADATSYAALLENNAMAAPESSLYGTANYRCAVWQHMGDYDKSTNGRRYPLIMGVIEGLQAMFGSATRINDARPFDRPPYNRVSQFTNVTNTWAKDSVSDLFWKHGANYVRYANREELFWPAMQTVYPNDTSVLNSVIIRQIAIDVVSCQEYAWTLLSGDTSMSPGEFIVESNRIVNELLANKYGTRVNYEVETLFTPSDEARGYSWTNKVTLYANVMKTANDIQLVTRRIKAA